MKEIYTRTLTGIVFLITVIGSILLDPLAFLIVFSVFCFIGLKEFYRLANLPSPGTVSRATPEFYIFGLLIYAIIGLVGLGFIDIRYSSIIFVIFFLQIAIELFRKKDPQWKNIAVTLTGYIYISIPFGLMNSLFYFGAVDEPRVGILIGMFALVWTSDIFAYLTGSMFGKHKLMENEKDIRVAIDSHLEMLNQMIADLTPQLEQAITEETVNNLQRIYLVGCGDSYFASLGVRMFFAFH